MTEKYPSERPAPDPEALNDNFAGHYDKFTSEQGFLGVNNPVEQIFEYMRPDDVTTVLDLGTGTGQTIEAVKRYRANPERIVAVDISSGMLEKLGEKGLANIEPAHSPIEDYVSGCQERFDLITAMGSMEFVPGLPVNLHHIAGLLNQNGVLAFTYRPRPNDGKESEYIYSPTLKAAIIEYYWPPETIERSLTSKGLIIEGRLTYNPYKRGQKAEEETISYNFIVARKP